MSFISPEEIAKKARNAYPKFLAAWIKGEDAGFFPYAIRTRLKADPRDSKATIAASNKLLEKSKARRGWGYTLHREVKRSRDFGENPFPAKIEIDMREDLLRLAGKRQEFAATERVATRVRDAFPQLEDWLIRSVKSLHKYDEPLEGLLGAAQYFIEHPWPDCYARQIPLAVDTKFVERNHRVLRQWLDALLPPSAIDVNEKTFARRFGLRDGLSHRGVRLLDSVLADELGLPFEELSLPLRSIAMLPAKELTAVIVENQLNLLTLPPLVRTVAVQGDGAAVTLLRQVGWLANNRLLYWGDVDVEGFLILASLRKLFPQAESVMMDFETLQQLETLTGAGVGKTQAMPTNLTCGEQAAFAWCLEGNRRLEQEKIPQAFVDGALARVSGSREAK